MIDYVKKSNWFNKIKAFKLEPLKGALRKIGYKQEISTDNEVNNENEKNLQPLDSPLDLDEKYSTRDKTPLSFNTLQTIALFKKGAEFSDTPKNGGNFENEGLSLDKLTRYQVLFNFLIEHSNGEELPEEKFIVENCTFKNKKISRKMLKNHKKEGEELGDLYQKTPGGAYFLKRTEKY